MIRVSLQIVLVAVIMMTGTLTVAIAREPLCDLIITHVDWTPSVPTEGDMITFTATIKNIGLAASPFGFEIPVTVRFSNLIIFGTRAKEPTPAARKGIGRGLSADYYNGKNFEIYLFSRTDSVVDFNFGYGDPVDIRMGYEDYSIQWTGFLEPVKSGKHTIS